MATEQRKREEEADLCGARCIHLDRVARAREESVGPDLLERLARTFGVLADPTRLALVMALTGGEMCVCDLAAFLGVSPSAVSHQLARLRDLALVRRRRDGQMLYYSLDDDHVADLLTTGLAHMKE
ncbi:MAG: metalloregulator ArsR/SmtB family transcription factor [Proteobacteria bacterium]|nr:metalloregulator ArsR/SmtB family transcription factor [Pseudomonadota bacterium]